VRAADAQRWMPREGFEYEDKPSSDYAVLLIGFLGLHDSGAELGSCAESEDVKERDQHT
jgi:hypothetical protein